MSMTILLALAAAIPDVPAGAVQILQENKTYVLRTLIDNKPLYTYDRDEPGKSNCTAECAKAWLPLWAPRDAKPLGKWTLLKRDDGSNQWAYEGKPVYSYTKDPEGVATGNGMGGTWHLLPTFPAS